MSGDIDNLGAAVTAALAGGAVEPGHDGAARKSAASANVDSKCLNCDADLTGPFCHNCGQKAVVHRSLSAIGHDLLHAVMHFDGKFWRTLPLLGWRPGDLTRRYIGGQRARFVSPLALFLFAVFLTYAVLASVGTGENGFDTMAAAERQQTVNSARIELRDNLANIDQRLAKAVAAGQPTAELQTQRDALITTAKMMELVDYSGPQPQISDEAQQSFVVTDIETGVPFFDDGVKKANENPGLLLYKIQANAYKFAWALIPLSMPFLWLLHPFSRQFKMFDHFVFVTYSLSFMLLLAVALRLVNLLPSAISSPLTIGGLLYIPFHMYRQLRGTYGSTRLGAIVQGSLLLVAANITLIMFFLLLLAMGLF